MSKIKGIKTIDVQAKQWFDKVNGNSYFAGVVTVNYGMKSERVIVMPFQYGYGCQYMFDGLKLVSDLYNAGSLYITDLRDKGVVFRYDIKCNCLKRELMAYK